MNNDRERYDDDSNRPRWKRRLLVAGAVLAIAAIGLGVWVWLMSGRLDRRLAAIRDAGNPTSIRELAPEPIPDAENAAAQLAAITPQLQTFAREHGSFFKTDLGKAYEKARDAGQPANAQQLAAIQAIVEQHPEITAAIAKAAACDRYASRLNFGSPHSQFLQPLLDAGSDLRTVARFTAWQMEVAVGAGRLDDAVQLGIRLLKIARLYESQPGAISLQLASAVRMSAVDALQKTLASGPISTDAYDELDAELAKQDDPQRLVRMLKTERAISISAMDEQFVQAAPPIIRTIGPYRSMQLGVLEAYDRMFRVADRPWYELAELPADELPFKTPTGLGVLADLLIPSLESSFVGASRDLALVRTLRIYSALRRFAAEQGSDATSIEQLKLPKDATIDPFSGQPLEWKKSGDDWLVYSVGKNQTDDGGNFKENLDVGIGTPLKAASD